VYYTLKRREYVRAQALRLYKGEQPTDVQVTGNKKID
jgi:hypothetical protein